MNIYKLLSSKLDYMLFCVGLIYVLTMAYYDTSNKETKSHNEQEIISTHLSNICITDSNNITICNSLEKNNICRNE